MFFLILTVFSMMIIIANFFIEDRISKRTILGYLVWWLFWLLLSNFNLFNLNSVSNTIYIILMIGNMSFFLGFLLSVPNKTHYQKIEENKQHFQSKLFMMVLIGLLAFIAYYRYKYFMVEIAGISKNLRMERFEVGNVFSSAKELLFFNYFIEPLVYLVVIILAYHIVNGMWKRPSIWLCMIIVILYSSIGNGRGSIIDVGLAVLILFLFRESKTKGKFKITSINIKEFKVYISLFLVFIIIFVLSSWISAKRLGIMTFSIKSLLIGVNDFFSQSIVYYTGPFRALEFGIGNYNLPLLFGRGFFSGIEELFQLLFSFFGLNFDSANKLIGDLLQNNQIVIGKEMLFNFAYTNLMTYYFDGGFIGIVIFSALFGSIFRLVILEYNKNRKIEILILVVFLNLVAYNSIFKWMFSSPAAVIFVLMIFLIKNNPIRKVLKKGDL